MANSRIVQLQIVIQSLTMLIIIAWLQCCGSGIGCFFDTRIRDTKKSGARIWDYIPDRISDNLESRNNFLG
jgi:hypothetical protein